MKHGQSHYKQEVCNDKLLKPCQNYFMDKVQ